MSQTDAGPATNNAEVVFGVTAWEETHVPSGLPSLAPSSAPIISPRIAPTNYAGNAATVLNTTIGSSLLVNPA
jgi:hypothetical protein